MIRFLFGRYSRLVRLLEVAGLFLTAIYFYGDLQAGQWPASNILLILLLAQYGFIRVCHGINWYPQANHRRASDPELGIEVHFVKALVPTSYILLCSVLLSFAGFPWLALSLANVMMIAICGLNGILITFHIRDPQPLPVNYFTRNLYLADENQLATNLERPSTKEASAA